jgi:glc operon protein GlcG
MHTHRPSLRWSLATIHLMALMCCGLSLAAQEPTPYGAPITLDRARTLIAAAEAEAKKQNWPVVIAIVDSGGYLVALARMDNTQLGSVEVAIQKATCSVLFRRPTKVFEDGLVAGGGNNRVLKAPGVLPIEGGVPIIVDGRIIGAIGVSGVKPTEDGQVAQAALLAK